MARKYNIPVPEKEQPKLTCRDCSHSYGWWNKGADGQMIFGYCPFHKNGKFCKFLSDQACKQFKQR